MMWRRSVILILSEVLMWFCCAYAKTNAKTVSEGQTVMVPILKTSALGIHDQLFTFFKGNSTSNRDKLCAQYFCDNGICVNDPSTVVQFKVQDDDIFLGIPNVNMNDSGQYRVSHNGITVVCNFTLDVHKSEQMKNIIVIPKSSVLSWLVPTIISVLVAVGLMIAAVIYCSCIRTKKKDHETETAAEKQELMDVITEPNEQSSKTAF